MTNEAHKRKLAMFHVSSYVEIYAVCIIKSTWLEKMYVCNGFILVHYLLKTAILCLRCVVYNLWAFSLAGWLQPRQYFNFHVSLEEPRRDSWWSCRFFTVRYGPGPGPCAHVRVGRRFFNLPIATWKQINFFVNF